MSKTRSVLAGMLILTCLISPFAFSAFGKKPDPNQTIPQLQVLSSDEFKQKVAAMDAQNQAKLDTQLAKLLGSKQSPANSFSAQPAPGASSTTTTTLQTMTPADTNTQTTTAPAPASTSSGPLNLYQN